MNIKTCRYKTTSRIICKLQPFKNLVSGLISNREKCITVPCQQWQMLNSQRPRNLIVGHCSVTKYIVLAQKTSWPHSTCYMEILSHDLSSNGVFPKFSRTFIEFREYDKPLKHESGSIQRSCLSHVSW